MAMVHTGATDQRLSKPELGRLAGLLRTAW
jgi:hypothetical protein